MAEIRDPLWATLGSKEKESLDESVLQKLLCSVPRFPFAMTHTACAQVNVHADPNLCVREGNTTPLPQLLQDSRFHGCNGENNAERLPAIEI